MTALKKRCGAIALMAGMIAGSSVHAAGGIPVLDAANLAKAVDQITAWSKQYQQMNEQIQSMQRAYESVNGIRNMGNLVNNPALRQYLPAEYQQVLSQGVGQWEAIRNAAKTFDISLTSLSASSDAVKAFEQAANQAALNRATAEAAYNNASQRFADIQLLLDKVNTAPDAKDIADLQARIQAEQVMMQNEANKLQMLSQLASAQRDLQDQQVREIRIKSLRGPMPEGW